MEKLNPLEAGCDLEGLKHLFIKGPYGNFFMDLWKDDIIDTIGEDKIIDKIGEDKITKALINKLGKKRFHELLDKLEKEEENNT